jgi:hypothetical protein
MFGRLLFIYAHEVGYEVWSLSYKCNIYERFNFTVKICAGKKLYIMADFEECAEL